MQVENTVSVAAIAKDMLKVIAAIPSSYSNLVTVFLLQALDIFEFAGPIVASSVATLSRVSAREAYIIRNMAHA
jgi:hypothetical protein